MSYPDPYIVKPAPGHSQTHTVILLHGRSSTAKEFANDLFSLKTSDSALTLPCYFPGFRWVFLDAGERWCSAFNERRSAWFDTLSLEDLSHGQDLQIPGLRDGIHHVRRIVESETDRMGGDASKIVLCGFSQGSAVALWSLLTGAATTRGQLGGFIGLSAWMPYTREARVATDLGSQVNSDRQSSLVENLSNTFVNILEIQPIVATALIQDGIHKLPVYLGHGIDDAVVSVTNCHEISAVFQALSFDVVVREYTGAKREGHWVKDPEQMDDIVDFVRVRILGE